MWTFDFLCLVASLRAVGANVPWHGVLLAYGAAQIVASIPIVPGGLGLVEGSLAVILVAYGVGHVGAVSGALLWRFVTYWLMIATGWAALGVLEYLRRHAERPTNSFSRTRPPVRSTARR